MKPAYSIAVAVFAIVAGVTCAVVSVKMDDGFLRGVALGMFLLAGLNLSMAWKLRRRG